VNRLHNYKWLFKYASPFLLVTAYLLSTMNIANAQESTSAWVSSPLGDTIIRPFAHAPYPHASRENGHIYQGKKYEAATSYSDSSVGIFVPAGYQPGQVVDYVIHAHGWNNHVSQVLDHYRLREQLSASGVNAILIVPQGPRDAPDSGGGKLELDKGAFKELLTEITDYLVKCRRIHTHTIGKIVLSTHSGGYAVTGAILHHGGLTDHITDVLLFDSSYGSLDWFVDWVAAGRKRRLVSIFTEHLASENFMLISSLQARRFPFTTQMVPDMTDEALEKRHAIFLHTRDIEHDEIIQKIDLFDRFLRTSALPQRKTD